MPNKIAHVFLPNDILGGAEYFLKNCTRYLSKELDFKVYVYFMKERISGAWDDLDDNVILNYGKAKKERIAVLHWLFNMSSINPNEVDMVLSSHAHINGFLGIIRSLGKLKTKRLIVRESNAVFDRYRGVKLQIAHLLHRLGYTQTDLIICQTEYMKEAFLKGISFSNKLNVQTIPNPIPLNEIRKRAEELEEVKLGDKEFIVAAGRLIDLKGFDVLIKAFAQLTDKNIHLVILGEGENRSQLMSLAKQYEILKRFHLPGFVSNPMPYFKNAKLCVVSSILEGFPNVLLQMMAVNDNVVSTKCAGGIDKIPSIVSCEVNNEDDLNRALSNALENQQINTNKRRKDFDDYLDKRSMASFIEQMFKFSES